tara:strand:+ start:50015 stop:50650 length:636 start_codon:yes stop_codon:yes gene_type:complete
LSKRITNQQKEELKLLFLSGEDIKTLADKFKYSKLTITRNLKKILGQTNFENATKAIKVRNSKNKNENSNYKKIFNESEIDFDNDKKLNQESFFEIVPLNENFDDSSRKDLSSVSITEFTFPKIVYMVVDKKIELNIKTLKEYPEWQFLSKEELQRKTIQIFNDLKIAKRECSKEDKVIKVPNTNVFKIVAPILASRGVTRIINDDKLISL